MSSFAMRAIVAGVAVAFAGCVPSNATTFGPVSRDLDRRLGVAATWSTESADARVPAAVAALLQKPLDRDAAVRIAVANNRHLQAEYERLGIAAAAVADATVLRPTEVDLDHKFASGGHGETELTAVQDVLDLLQIGQRRGAASAELLAAQRRAVAATVELAARVEAAYYDVVAAQQEVELRRTAFDAASASAEIVERQHAANNVTELALARERSQREQSRIELGRAQAEVEIRREALNALLGTSGADTQWTIEERLPRVPDQPPALDDLEQAAVGDSLELAAIRADAEAAAGRVGIARVRAWLPEIAIGGAAAKRDGGDWEVGPAIRIGLPIFDQQQGPRARANAELRRAQDELTATAVELRAEARAARQRALATYEEARHLKDVVLPLRQQVLEQTLLQYNAMNASSFELLTVRRDQVDAGRQYIDALRRYWIAMSEVEALRRGVMPPRRGETP
jgi:outer membrane protein, heavy metal efflux system